jgi:hypothetical protein
MANMKIDIGQFIIGREISGLNHHGLLEVLNRLEPIPLIQEGPHGLVHTTLCFPHLF